MEVLLGGHRGREVLEEGVLPSNRSGGCRRKKHNGRKPRFRFQMEKTLQDTWGKQPDIINVKFIWEHKEQPEAALSWSGCSLHGGAWDLMQ